MRMAAMGTRRQQIIEQLTQRPSTVRALASDLGLRISEVKDDLVHIQRSVGQRLQVSPSRCEACGFEMSRARRFTAPSRCPRCKSERTTEPLISVDPA